MLDWIADISIHAPRVGRDRDWCRAYEHRQRFQSTRPVWGATRNSRRRTRIHIYFNPRAPCGARPLIKLLYGSFLSFQSTRPVWGATTADRQKHLLIKISIHAPRVGRDGKRGHDFPLLPRIYGHSPPQIRFSRHLRPTPLLRHDSRTYIFTFCFLFTSPSHSVINAQMMMAASKS